MSEKYVEPKVVDAKLAVDSESRKWGMFCYLSALIGFIIPFGSIIAPLIIWQMKKDVSLFVDEQGKESINFQISMAIWMLISWVLVFLYIGFILLGFFALLEIICVIMAGVQANEGKSFRYPLTIRFIK
jgi:uncharacterized Tic20 family protein